MIRGEDQYRAALAEIRRDQRIAREQERLLRGFGLRPHEVDEALTPIRFQTERLRREIAAYERIRRPATQKVLCASLGLHPTTSGTGAASAIPRS